MKTEKTMSGQSVLWGSALAVWDTWGVRLMMIGAVLGFIALAVSLASSFILWKVSGTAQAELATKTADLAVQLEAQRAIAEEAKLALEQFKAPRTLSEQEKDSIVATLSRFAGQEYSGNVVVSVPDGERLWNTIDWMLRTSGWTRAAKTWDGDRSSDPPYDTLINASEGVGVLFPAQGSRLASAADALAATLNNAGIAAHSAENKGPRQRAGIIEIEIGAKPK